MKQKFIVLFICFLCFSSPLFAHEFLMKPDVQKVEKKKPITVDVMETHIFIMSEELPVSKDVEVFAIQGKNSAVPVALETVTTENLLRGTFFAETDEGVLVVGKRNPQYWSNTTEGILAGNRVELEAQGKKVLSVGRYEKYALMFIPGTKASIPSEYTIPGGKPPLVILPNFDPNTVKVGQKLSFSIMINGKPFGGAHINITYDGFSKEESVFVKTKKSSKKGMVTFKPDKPGLWIIHTESAEKMTKGPADEQNIRSAILFWVNP